MTRIDLGETEMFHVEQHPAVPPKGRLVLSRYTPRRQRCSPGTATPFLKAPGHTRGDDSMSIPLAAVGAVVVALLEVRVFPEMTIAGVKPDLIFIFSVTATMMIGIEVGLTWAFVGGLMLDLLTPGRQLGVTSLVLLLLAGAIILTARLLPQGRVLVATGAVFVLAWGFQVLEAAILGATTGLDPMIDWTPILATALIDAAVALPIAALMRFAWLRFGATERMEW